MTVKKSVLTIFITTLGLISCEKTKTKSFDGGYVGGNITNTQTSITNPNNSSENKQNTAGVEVIGGYGTRFNKNGYIGLEGQALITGRKITENSLMASDAAIQQHNSK